MVENHKLKSKIAKAENENIKIRKELLKTQGELNSLQSFLRTKQLHQLEEREQEKSERVVLQAYENQIRSLTAAFEDIHQECTKLLKEKKSKLQKESIELYKLDSDSLSKIDSSLTPLKNNFPVNLSAVGLKIDQSIIAPSSLFSSQLSVELDKKGIVAKTKYAESLGLSKLEEKMAPETYSYFLKNLLYDAEIINLNLKEVLSYLIWKLLIDRSELDRTREMNRVLKISVERLEVHLKKITELHEVWKGALDKLEYDTSQITNIQLNPNIKANQTSLLIQGFKRIRKPIQRLHYQRKKELLKSKEGCTPISSFEVSKAEEADFPDIFQTLGPNFRDDINFSKIERNEFAPLKHKLRETQVELSWNKTLNELLVTELRKERELLGHIQKEREEIQKHSENLVKEAVRLLI